MRNKEKEEVNHKTDTLNSDKVSLSTLKPLRHSFTRSFHTHIEGCSHTTGVRAAATGSHQMLQWEKEFFSFSFSKSLAQVGTPSCCSGAKGNKPPKNGYGGKFSLLRGEAYKNKADGEREGGERLFSTLSQRCLNRTQAHIQNRSNGSYLIVPELKATGGTAAKPFPLRTDSHSLLLS